MKRTILSTLLISVFALSAIFITSCKKDKKDEDKKEEPKPPTNKELVMSNTWKVTKVMSQGIDVWNSSILPIFQPCQKDNTYQFQADDLLLIDEGETKCNDADAQTQQGAWMMVGKDRMFIDVIFLTDTAEIVSISKTQLVLKANIESFGVDGDIYFDKVK